MKKLIILFFLIPLALESAEKKLNESGKDKKKMDITAMRRLGGFIKQNKEQEMNEILQSYSIDQLTLDELVEEAFELEHVNIVEMLLNTGADLRKARVFIAKNIADWVHNNKIEIVDYALKKVRFNQKSLNLLLLSAVQRNYVDLIRKLLAAGADPNYGTSSGDSPLLTMWAKAYYVSVPLEIPLLLIDAGARLSENYPQKSDVEKLSVKKRSEETVFEALDERPQSLQQFTKMSVRDLKNLLIQRVEQAKEKKQKYGKVKHIEIAD